jgi:hypothetical protein
VLGSISTAEYKYKLFSVVLWGAEQRVNFGICKDVVNGKAQCSNSLKSVPIHFSSAKYNYKFNIEDEEYGVHYGGW